MFDFDWAFDLSVFLCLWKTFLNDKNFFDWFLMMECWVDLNNSLFVRFLWKLICFGCHQEVSSKIWFHKYHFLLQLPIILTAHKAEKRTNFKRKIDSIIIYKRMIFVGKLEDLVPDIIEYIPRLTLKSITKDNKLKIKKTVTDPFPITLLPTVICWHFTYF